MFVEAPPKTGHSIPLESSPKPNDGSNADQILPPFPDNVPTAAIKVISLRNLRQGDLAESYELFKACCEYGFFHLDLRDDHASQESVTSSLLDILPSIFESSVELHNLPDAEKSSLSYGPPRQLFGHKALGRNKVEDGSPDRYEAWTFAKDDFLGIQTGELDDKKETRALVPPRPQMPNIALKRRSNFVSYVRAANDIVELVCSHLDQHLGLPRGTLASLQRLDSPSQTSIRLLRYPPHENALSSAGVRKSLVGHTDIGTITVLADNGIGGLQILPPGAATSEDSDWKYVQPKPGCVVVNLGDAMTEWSGGILRSDLHRVVSPPGEQVDVTRYSIAYLARPARHARMEPLKDAWKTNSDQDETDKTCGCAAKVWTALEWEVRKSQSIINGSDVAHSKGGIPVERWTTAP